MIPFDKKTMYTVSVVLFVVLSGVVYLSFFTGRAPDRPTTVVITLPVDEVVSDVDEPLSSEITEGRLDHLEDILIAEAVDFPTADPDEVVVFVSGAVYAPGVFTLLQGARKIDAVELAGGFTAEADLNSINLAQLLTDTQHVIVPVIGQVVSEPVQLVTNQPAPVETGITDGLVNINTADISTLQTLPGIGPVLSQNIVNHRQAHGAFATIDELQNVPQIGVTTVNNLRGLITVTGQ